MPLGNKTLRIEARINPETLEIIRYAANLQGRSVSDFLVTAAQEVARRTIEEEHLIRLSIEDQRRFIEALLAPPALSPALERAKEAHTRLIKESGK